MSDTDILSAIPLYEKFDDSDYYKSFYKNNIRPDGRKFNEYRRLSVRSGVITANNVYGSAQVQLDKTIVMCGINIMVGSPSMADPDKGDLGMSSITLLCWLKVVFI